MPEYLSREDNETPTNIGQTDYDKAVEGVLYRSKLYDYPFSRIAITNEVVQSIPEDDLDSVVVSLIRLLDALCEDSESSIDQINSLADIVEQDYLFLSPRWQEVWSVRMDKARKRVLARREQGS